MWGYNVYKYYHYVGISSHVLYISFYFIGQNMHIDNKYQFAILSFSYFANVLWKFVK